jgi:hypothetical protein
VDVRPHNRRVDRPEPAGNEPAGNEREAAGDDRPPQESDSGSAPKFDGDELYGKPQGEDAGGESTLDDPNGGLPF